MSQIGIILLCGLIAGVFGNPQSARAIPNPNAEGFDFGRALSAASAAANAIRESGILNNRPSGRRPSNTRPSNTRPSNTRPSISRPSVSRPRPTPRRNIITRPRSNTVSNIRSNVPSRNSNARPAPISTNLVGKLVEEIEQDICDAVNGGTAVSGSLGDVCEENVDSGCTESKPCIAYQVAGEPIESTSGVRYTDYSANCVRNFTTNTTRFENSGLNTNFDNKWDTRQCCLEETCEECPYLHQQFWSNRITIDDLSSRECGIKKHCCPRFIVTGEEIRECLSKGARCINSIGKCCKQRKTWRGKLYCPKTC